MGDGVVIVRYRVGVGQAIEIAGLFIPDDFGILFVFKHDSEDM